MILKLWVLAVIVGITLAITTTQNNKERIQFGEQIIKLKEKTKEGEYIPVVLMHGVAQGSHAMDLVVSWLNESMPGAYVRNMEIGDGLWDSIFMHMDNQIETYADNIRSDSNLANGFNAIGFSQGTLVTRGYIERFNDPPVFNYIGWVGPQDGQYGTPYVNIAWIDALLATIPYDDFVQRTIAPAQYWKDPLNIDTYLNKSTFLADLNNERPEKNATYKENILTLKNFVLVYGSADTVISPRESAWFYFYAPGSGRIIEPLMNQSIYTEDWLGLRTLNETGRLHLYLDNCTHFQHHTLDCKFNFLENTLPFLL